MLSSLRLAPLPVVLVVASFLAPTELSLYVQGIRLPPHRIVLLALFPLAVWRILRDPALRIRTFDCFFLAYNVWTLGVFIHHGHGGSGDGLQYGGSLALESFAAYVIARAYVRHIDHFRATLGVLVTAVAITFLIALPEAVVGVHYVHDWLKVVTGYDHPTAVEYRMGLARAYATFDHPIHLGCFVAGLFALVWLGASNPREQIQRAALVGATTLLGLSSAPILCLFVQASLVMWERTTRGMAHRTIILLCGIAALYALAAMVLTRSPIAFVATGMTLDSWTGYYRMLIWEHGLENVWANPLVGIGLGDWERPWWMVSASVDAFWLVITMRAGIPAFVLLVMAIALMTRAVNRRAGHSDHRDVRRIAIGWIISLVALSLVACTVHFWNVLYAYFFFMLGLGGWLADPLRRTMRAEAGMTAPRAEPRRAAPAQRPPTLDDPSPLPAPLPPLAPAQRLIRI